jgi:hypothetical protein
MSEPPDLYDQTAERGRWSFALAGKTGFPPAHGVVGLRQLIHSVNSIFHWS